MFGPIGKVIGLCMNIVSRKFEYEADEFATNMGFDLTVPLTKIHTDNASNLNPDPLFSLLNFSHPTLKERINAIDKLKAKRK